MKQFTDEQILAYLLGDSEDAHEMEKLKDQNPAFRNRVLEIEKLKNQLNALPFHLESPRRKPNLTRFASVLAIVLAFLAGAFSQSLISNDFSVQTQVSSSKDPENNLKVDSSISSLGADPKTIM